MRADFCKHIDEQSFKKRDGMLDFEADPIVHDLFRVMVVEMLRISWKASIMELIKAWPTILSLG